MKIFSPTISGSSQTSGSLTISGSLNVSQGITGSLLGTASWATNVVNGGGGGSVGTLAQVTALGASTTVPITASIISASSFTGSLLGTASWAQSASNAINSQTASFLPVGTYNITASWAQSASNAINARTASFLPVGTYSITSSWATNALTASYILNAVSSSFATTASFALNGGVTSIAAGSGISINQSTGNVIITNASAGGATFPYTGSAIISGSLIVTGSLNTTQGGIDAIRIKETSLTNAGQYDRGVTLADTWSSSGPTLIAGRIVYLSGSGQWAEAVASATGSSTGVLGVVTTTANQNDIVLHGLVRVSQSLAGFTNGRPVYLSPLTAGIVTETPPSTAGQVGRYVGYTIDSASRQIYFNPDFTWIQL